MKTLPESTPSEDLRIKIAICDAVNFVQHTQNCVDGYRFYEDSCEKVVEDRDWPRIVGTCMDRLSEAQKIRFSELLASHTIDEYEGGLYTIGWYDAVEIHLDKLRDLVFASWQTKAIIWLKTIERPLK